MCVFGGVHARAPPLMRANKEKTGGGDARACAAAHAHSNALAAILLVLFLHANAFARRLSGTCCLACCLVAKNLWPCG